MKLFSWFGFRQIRNQLLAPCLMFNKAEKIFILNTKKMIKTLVCVIVPFWGLKSSNKRALIQFNNFSLFKLFLKMWNDMCSEHQLSLTYESFVRISRRHFFSPKNQGLNRHEKTGYYYYMHKCMVYSYNISNKPLSQGWANDSTTFLISKNMNNPK